MRITPSTLFDFLASHPTPVINRYEFASCSFSSLRRSLRQIASEFQDADAEAAEMSQAIQRLLCEWLTVPVAFARTRDALVRLLGTPEHVGIRWGSKLRSQYASSLQAAEELAAGPNPMREMLVETVRQLTLQGRSFRILCHRHARPHFESLISSGADSPIGEHTFMRSAREYRESAIFDALLKVGPLRSFGWGAAPDAIATAPRFAELIQFVWSGCGDDPGFGYDPALPSWSGSDAATLKDDRLVRSDALRWMRRVIRVGVDTEVRSCDDMDVDDLKVFSEMNRERYGQPAALDERPATLVQIDDQNGILYPPHSQALSFDPSFLTREPFDRRVPGETLTEGMYVIRPVMDDVDLGRTRAEHGRYTSIWKERLWQRWRADPLDGLDLVLRLQVAGLDLEDLPGAIEHWCKPPTTVIHAPKRVKHFEILMRVIGLADQDVNAGQKGPPFWKLAWNEIRHSRSEAIQAGVQESEIIEEQLISLLTKQLSDVRSRAVDRTQFTIPIPPGNGIKGVLEFFRVQRIEEGFRVHDGDLKVVLPLTEIEQWRD